MATLTGVLVVCAQSAIAEPMLSVLMFDGNPHDRILIRNSGDCAFATGILTLDFTTSAGGVLIDTEYGGLGTQDPMPVEVEAGPLIIDPVMDGDRHLVIKIGGLAPSQTGAVTLDVDNQASGWRASRVSIIGEHLVGATAGFATLGHSGISVFNDAGATQITLPAEACAPPEVPVTSVPMS